MARKPAQQVDLTTPKKRATLPVRRNPYFHTIMPGRFIGWRRMTKDSPGNWSAKFHHKGEDLFLPLGSLEQFDDVDRFARALEAATKWFDSLTQAGQGMTKVISKITLQQVTMEYAQSFDNGTDKGKRKALIVAQRFAKMVLPFDPDNPCDAAGLPKTKKEMAEFTGSWLYRPVVRITTAQYKAWFDWMATIPTHATEPDHKQYGHKRTYESMHREMTSLRAALNRAHALYGIPNVWKNAFSELKENTSGKAAKQALKKTIAQEFGGRAPVYITREQRQEQLIACAKVAPDFLPFMQAMLTAPIRPGAYAAMDAGDYHPAKGPHPHYVHVGDDKCNGNRDVPLPNTAQVRALFAGLTRDKLPGAPLFMSESGKRWNNNMWGRRYKKVVAAAGHDATLFLYCLRHSLITDMVAVPGTSALMIAEVAGTSVKMIEDTYYHLQADQVRDALQAVGF